jgi:hypothetical protein
MWSAEGRADRLFLQAYRRSAQRYTVIRGAVGDPDPFRVTCLPPKWLSARHTMVFQQSLKSVPFSTVIFSDPFRSSSPKVSSPQSKSSVWVPVRTRMSSSSVSW